MSAKTHAVYCNWRWRGPAATSPSESRHSAGTRLRARRALGVVPGVGVRGEACALLVPHDTEALAGGGLHHTPVAHHAHLLCAELHQPRHFGVHIIRLDVQMHPAWVLDLLHLDAEVSGTGLEGAIVRVGWIRRWRAHRKT